MVTKPLSGLLGRLIGPEYTAPAWSSTMSPLSAFSIAAWTLPRGGTLMIFFVPFATITGCGPMIPSLPEYVSYPMPEAAQIRSAAAMSVHGRAARRRVLAAVLLLTVIGLTAITLTINVNRV